MFQEESSVRAGMEVAQEADFPATRTQGDFVVIMKFPPTSPKLRASRREPWSMDETKMRQSNLGDPC